jgi:hypothetical protein
MLYVNYNSERLWKEEVVVYFKVLFQHFLGGAKENHKNPVRIAGLQATV